MTSTLNFVPHYMLCSLFFLSQFELLDTLYVVLRQMPRFRRASYFYAPSNGDGSCRGGGPTGREFDNMAEFLAYRCVFVVCIRCV